MEKPSGQKGKTSYELLELCGMLHSKATQTSEMVKAGVLKPHLKPQQSIDASIEYLRVSIKYLLFDLEATRRELDYLRKKGQ